MNEHDAHGLVTWRDLREERSSLLAEIDRRFSEHAQQHKRDYETAQEALRLARDALREALAKTNEFREEAVADKDKYAEKNLVDAALAKMEQSLRTDINKDIQSLSTRITTQATTTSTAGEKIDKLQKNDDIARGKDLGLLGLVASAGGAIVYGLIQLLGK